MDKEQHSKNIHTTAGKRLDRAARQRYSKDNWRELTLKERISLTKYSLGEREDFGTTKTPSTKHKLLEHKP